MKPSRTGTSICLENARYTGADGWPEIVPPDVFHGAARLRESKTDGWRPHPDCNDAVKRKLTCAACGTPYRVKTSSRDGVRWWHCGNDNCGGMLKMRDSELERSVTVLLNILIAKPELLEMPHIPAPLSFESERIQNELYRELGKPDWNVDYAKTLAFARAAEIYDALGNDEIIRQNAVVLQNRISLMKPLTAFDRELFCAAVDTVLAGADGSLALKLISGGIIENTQGKEEHNADTDATATT